MNTTTTYLYAYKPIYPLEDGKVMKLEKDNGISLFIERSEWHTEFQLYIRIREVQLLKQSSQTGHMYINTGKLLDL